jgi:hypothetical protein
MPAQPIAATCPLCGQRRRSLPSQVFQDRLSWRLLRKPVRSVQGDFLIRIGLDFLKPVLTLLVWGLVVSTLLSMDQRFWFSRAAAKPVF